MMPITNCPSRPCSLPHAKSVVVWGSAALLDYVMEFLLQTLAGWEIVRLPTEEKVETLIALAEAADPEALIICETKRPANGVSANSFPAQFMRKHKHLKVLVLNPSNNLVEVINKQMVLVQQSSDLLSLIENHPTDI